MPKPPEPTLNQPPSDQLGGEVVKLDALPVGPGQLVRVHFESTDSAWRQGVRLTTGGVLTVNSVSGPQLDLWQDTAPENVEITCSETDGLLRIYNVWQTGRRPGVESRGET
jgi:hypothetical protein